VSEGKQDRVDSPPARPLFSVIISTYNRAGIVQRCVRSCLAQTYPDFEVIVVDDGSTDDTVGQLRSIADPRLKVISHASNRGMTPARRTGVEHSSGEWIVVLDSDWELFPNALSRLAELVPTLPDGVRVLWFRLIYETGEVTPTVVPAGATGYRARVAMLEEHGTPDAARCVHRSVFERTPYFPDRRGAMDWLYELDLAKHETQVFVEDVLATQYLDAPNSYLRTTDRSDLMTRLIREAPDMQWMVETTLARHGEALREVAPSHYRELLRWAALQSFLLAERRKGLRYGWRSALRKPTDLTVWATLALGMLGPRALLNAIVAQRRYSSHRALKRA